MTLRRVADRHCGDAVPLRTHQFRYRDSGSRCGPTIGGEGLGRSPSVSDRSCSHFAAYVGWGEGETVGCRECVVDRPSTATALDGWQRITRSTGQHWKPRLVDPVTVDDEPSVDCTSGPAAAWRPRVYPHSAGVVGRLALRNLTQIRG